MELILRHPLDRSVERACASQTPINFSEVYTSLQTKVVDGQENALPLIYTTKLYEVQNSISIDGPQLTKAIADSLQKVDNFNVCQHIKFSTANIINKS